MNNDGKSNYDYVRAVRAGQCGSFGDYIENGDGTVTDTDTGLMWEVKTVDNMSKRYNWKGALDYCETLTLADYNGWRLPNRNELQSIVDYSQYDPSIDTTFFPNTASYFYWSSTTSAYYPNYAWVVYFYTGYMYRHNKSYTTYVRAVRFSDLDGDSIPDISDNCPDHHNPGQEDTMPSGGNSCGDACECEGDFEPDGDLDGVDAFAFKTDFFREDCAEPTPCNGDFECDGDVDGTDAVKFKADFFRKDCPSCGGWPCGYE